MAATQHRDIVVVGSSSGGLAALRRVLGGLPEEFPAAVFIVQHQAATSGRLTALLDAATELPVVCVDGELAVKNSCVFVAPPDRHIVLTETSVVPTRGARENCARPSINTLFRSAAAGCNSRVIAVQLTGMLDDGVAGLEAVQRSGGLVVVQDPEDAAFPDMPRHALEALTADHVAPLAELPALLTRLAGAEVQARQPPRDVVVEARLAGPGPSTAMAVGELGEQVALGCPECGGPLWQRGHGAAAMYRCHTGHAFTPHYLLGSQTDEIEHSLWAAVRALTERARVLTRLAGREDERSPAAALAFRERADEATVQAEQARQFLVSLNMDVPDENLDRLCADSL